MRHVQLQQVRGRILSALDEVGDTASDCGQDDIEFEQQQS